MKTALESSVLPAPFSGEADSEVWLEALTEARREGQLVVCDIVYAEIDPAFVSDEDLRAAPDKLGASFEPASPGAASLDWCTNTIHRFPAST